MCDIGGGGGGGGFGGGFGGGGGGGLDLGLDFSGLDFSGLSGGGGFDDTGTTELVEIPAIEVNVPDPSDVIAGYASSRANQFADLYDQTRTDDAVTKGYYANARKLGIARNASNALQGILDAEDSRKATAVRNYENKIVNKYPDWAAPFATPADTDNPFDMDVINEGLVDQVDDGTRLATVGGARRFVGRLAPKLFGGENIKPLDRFKTRRRFQRDNNATSGFSGFDTLGNTQRRADD